MNYKEDMERDINKIFTCSDIYMQEKAKLYKGILFETPIWQEHNPLFHDIRKHKLELLDEIIEDWELIK